MSKLFLITLSSLLFIQLVLANSEFNEINKYLVENVDSDDLAANLAAVEQYAKSNPQFNTPALYLLAMRDLNDETLCNELSVKRIRDVYEHNRYQLDASRVGQLVKNAIQRHSELCQPKYIESYRKVQSVKDAAKLEEATRNMAIMNKFSENFDEFFKQIRYANQFYPTAGSGEVDLRQILKDDKEAIALLDKSNIKPIIEARKISDSIIDKVKGVLQKPCELFNKGLEDFMDRVQIDFRLADFTPIAGAEDFYRGLGTYLACKHYAGYPGAAYLGNEIARINSPQAWQEIDKEDAVDSYTDFLNGLAGRKIAPKLFMRKLFGIKL